jgi:hypothetical protein
MTRPARRSMHPDTSGVRHLVAKNCWTVSVGSRPTGLLWSQLCCIFCFCTDDARGQMLDGASGAAASAIALCRAALTSINGRRSPFMPTLACAPAWRTPAAARRAFASMPSRSSCLLKRTQRLQSPSGKSVQQKILILGLSKDRGLSCNDGPRPPHGEPDEPRQARGEVLEGDWMRVFKQFFRCAANTRFEPILVSLIPAAKPKNRSNLTISYNVTPTTEDDALASIK